MSSLPAAGVASKRLTQTEVDIICTRHERLWSAKQGGARANFAFADLSGLSLAGRNLADADFSGATMAGVNFNGCKLDNAVLFGADMQGATFREASLRRADLRGASLRGADLTGADMFEADLREGSIAAADSVALDEVGATMATEGTSFRIAAMSFSVKGTALALDPKRLSAPGTTTSMLLPMAEMSFVTLAVAPRGHAVQARLYAEDPWKNFQPSTGVLTEVLFPPALRVDTWVERGTEVTAHYDPMLAKLIAWAPTREEAITKMLYALDDVVFAGIKSNRDYLRRLLSHKDFKAGKTHTHFIPDHKEELLPTAVESVKFAPHIAAYLLSGVKRVSKGEGAVASTPWMTLNGLRN